MRTVWVIAAIVTVFALGALGLWVRNLRTENTRLESRVARMENRARVESAQTAREEARLKAQVQSQQNRLRELRENLNEVVRLGVQPPTGSVDAHISNLTRRIAALEGQLRALNAEAAAVQNGARAYRLQQQSGLVQTELDVRGRIQAIDQRMLQLEASPEAPGAAEELARLRIERQSLVNQAEAVAPVAQGAEIAVNQQVFAEMNEIEAEKRAIQTQIEDLRGNLAYWREQRSGRAPAGVQPARVRELESEIRTQQEQLNAIQSDLGGR